MNEILGLFAKNVVDIFLFVLTFADALEPNVIGPLKS